MRLSPVPVMFWRAPGEAMRVASDQSRTTHQGIEAAECCRLLAFLCSAAIREGGGRSTLERLSSFRSERYGVQALAESRVEERHPENAEGALEDRDWRWRRPDHAYSPARSQARPGYVGSYCMDALAMALHCVASTRSFEEAVLKAVNRGGDSDSVGAVTGQIAGAAYGYRSIPAPWLRALYRWDRGRSIYRAGLLYRRAISSPTSSGPPRA
jgi:ADP-ribosylglycohydrolase